MQIITVSFPKKTVITVANTAKHVTSADLTQILLDLDAINGEVIGATAAEKTDKIEATKLAIETAIETAGGDVPALTVFADYADYIPKISDNYLRPSFWPALPAVALDGLGEPTEQLIYILMAVYPDNINKVTFLFAGNTAVEWGDGASDNYNAFDASTHEFDFDTVTSAITPRGYKTALIEIRPQTGQHLTFFACGINMAILALDLKIAMGAASPTTDLTVAVKSCPLLEQIEFVGKKRWITEGLSPTNKNLRKVVMDTSGVVAASQLLARNGVGSCLVFNTSSFDLRAATNITQILYYTNFLNPFITIQAPVIPFSIAYLITQSNIMSITFDDASLCNDTTTAFDSCFALYRLRLPGIKVSLSLVNCNFAADALNTLFGDLADLTGFTSQNITITGNPGAATCDTSIATAKNWTVTT